MPVIDADGCPINVEVEGPNARPCGRHDPATTPQDGEFVHSRIPGASLATLDAAHLSNVEQPTQFAKYVLEFLLAT